jgi:hypothetical protein
MTTDIDEARDWHGQPVDCLGCPQRALQTADRCRLQHACVQDRYARRIDRFFAWNPALANGHLEHPYFEVRAIAAKHADIFRLMPLLKDADETVRWSVAQRLPPRYLRELCNDSHREVRIRVAYRVEGGDLFGMRNDKDYYVRMVVARRLAAPLVELMINDPEPGVRRAVAQRVSARCLASLTTDPDAEVRLEVARRLSAEQLICLQRDADCRVRYEVASRIAADRLSAMLADADQMVCEMARLRLSPTRGGPPPPAYALMSERRGPIP